MLLSLPFELSLEIIIPLCIIIFLGLLLFIYFIHTLLSSSKIKRSLKSFTSGKNNLRLFAIDYLNESIYVVDKKNFKSKRRENYKWFYNSFTKEDAIRVKVWLSELIKNDHKVKDNLEVQVLINGTKIFSVFTCTGIDRENHIIHLESHLFPEIKNSRLKSALKEDKIASYSDLSTLFHSSKNEKFNIYLIRIFSYDNNLENQNIWTNKVLNTLLLSKIKKYLSGNMKICLSKQNEVIIIESHNSNKNKSIAFAHRFSSEVSKVLDLNGLKNAYTHRIGIATGHPKTQTFDELVNFARKMTIEASEENKDKIIYNSTYSNSEAKREIIEFIDNVIKNRQIDIDYTNMFNCSNGHLKGFYSGITIKKDFFTSYLEMQDYAHSYSLLNPLLRFFYSELNSIFINKYFLTREERRLFFKTRIQYYQDILDVVNSIQVPDNVKTVIVLQDKDITKEAISNNKNLYDYLCELKNDNHIRLGLEFSSTALEMSDEILELFDYFIFDQSNSFSQILTSTQDQILFQNLINNLLEYPKGKLTAVNLQSWQAIEFFSSLGFKYVSGAYFGSEVNKTPSIDTKKVNKLLSLYD